MGWANLASATLGSLLTIVALFFSVNLQLRFGWEIFTEQGLAVILGLALAVIFLRLPLRRSSQREFVPWYDALAALAALLASGHLAVRFPELALDFFLNETEALISGAILIPLIIEALRRTAGWILVSILGAFLIYGVLGHLVPGQLTGRSQDIGMLIPYLTVDTVALFGMSMVIVSTIVVMYIFLGQLLLRSGASEWFTEFAMAAMGGTRGGAAKISIIASGLFGTISGSAVSNVASTGVITIPLMKRSGLEPKVAGAFEAVASTGGQLMPPIMGAAAFLMSEFLQITYGEVILAALIPGLLYYVAVFIQADLEAARQGLAPLPKEMVPSFRGVIRTGWYFVLPFVILIYVLFELNKTPQEAALWAAGSVVALNWIFGYRGKRMGARDLIGALRDCGISSTDIVVIGAMAGLIIGVMEVTGLGFALTLVLVQFGEGNLFALLAVTAVICIILGMGMPTTAIYILVATLAAPPLVKLGIEPIAAHLFVFYFGLVSLITPPVAVAAFVAANLAGARPMATAVTCVRLGWPAMVVPFLFVLSPHLLLRGDPVEVAIAVITAILGVWLASAGMLGYFLRRLNVPLRLAFLVAGFALLVPAQAFEGANYLEVFGYVTAVLIVGWELIKVYRGHAVV